MSIVREHPKSSGWSLDIAGSTHQGLVRTRNEDQYLIGTTKRSLEIDSSSLKNAGRELVLGSAEGTLLMVADGMGGMGAGDVASATAIEGMAEAVCEALPFLAKHAEVPEWRPTSHPPEIVRKKAKPLESPAEARRRRRERRMKRKKQRKVETGGDDDDATILGIRSKLATAVERCNDRVREKASSEEGREKMGTTLTVAYLVPPLLYMAHVGDSRCYLLGHDSDELMQLTIDHTIAAQLEAAGAKVRADSHLHHVLWNALGARSHSLAGADVSRTKLHPGDSLLLCSDGLTNHVDDDTIREVLSSGSRAAHCCTTLIEHALDGGGSDNITVVVARVHEPI